MRGADAPDLLQDGLRFQRCFAQCLPIGAPAASDDVVDRRKSELIMIEVPMPHSPDDSSKRALGHPVELIGTQVQNKFRSPYGLSTRPTNGQNLKSLSHFAG